MSRRKVPFDTTITDDEFHPDHRVAARHADHNARVSAVKLYRDHLRRLLAKGEQVNVFLSRGDLQQVKEIRARIAELEQQINEDKEDDE